jgi:hypothetical protein
MSTKTRIAALAAVLLSLGAAAAAPARAAELSPDELLARYQPVTVLDAFERFAPTTVDGFVAGSDLQQLGADGSYEAVELPPPGLPVHGDGWRLDRRGCSALAGFAALGCYDAQDTGPSAVYGRHDVRAGTIVLQYWLFYEFNLWSLQYPPTSLVWQSHEGDWEVVTVVLDEEQRPVEAAYSQHCTGQRKLWAAVTRLGDHPVVYVANGSHANLFAPGVRPIAPSCLPAEAAAFLASLGIVPLDISNPVGGRILGPGTTAVERMHDNAPRWLRFPGTWGETQWLHAPAPIGTVPFGAGPEGPAFHDVWIDPLGTIAGYPSS